MKQVYLTRILGRVILLFLLGIFLFTSELYSQLNGTYTVGTTGDYATVNAAVTALSTQGVSGSVIFNIASGNYNEQVTIPSIAGASSENTITFQSATGDTADVKIYYDAVGSDNFVVHLSGAGFIKIKNLSLVATGTSDLGVVVKFTNNCNYNEFIGNHLYGKTGTSTNMADKVIVSANLGSTDTATVFKSNTFDHGKYGIFYGNGRNILLDGNTFINGTNDQLILTSCESLTLKNNTINGGIGFSYNGSKGIEIIGNTIIGTIDLYSLNSTLSNPSKIYNNFIRGKLSIRSCQYLNIYHNSVAVGSDYPYEFKPGEVIFIY